MSFVPRRFRGGIALSETLAIVLITRRNFAQRNKPTPLAGLVLQALAGIGASCWRVKGRGSRYITRSYVSLDPSRLRVLLQFYIYIDARAYAFSTRNAVSNTPFEKPPRYYAKRSTLVLEANPRFVKRPISLSFFIIERAIKRELSCVEMVNTFQKFRISI